MHGLMIGHRCGLITIIYIQEPSGEWSERARNGPGGVPTIRPETRELIKLNFMFLEKQDNYAPTFTQLAFNTCTQTLICSKKESFVFWTFVVY